MNNCGNCRFSQPARNPDGKIDFQRRLCRRREPTPLLIPSQGGIRMEFVWPVLDTTQWCGEWGNVEPLLPGEKADVAGEAEAKN